MTDYPTYRVFVEQVILPMRSANPTDKRLDGQPTGGNRDVVGRFKHQRRLWKVHADTHYEPLLLAYEALVTGETSDPFVATPTSRGYRLDLVPVLQARRLARHRHMYIYEVGAATDKGHRDFMTVEEP